MIHRYKRTFWFVATIRFGSSMWSLSFYLCLHVNNFDVKIAIYVCCHRCIGIWIKIGKTHIANGRKCHREQDSNMRYSAFITNNVPCRYKNIHVDITWQYWGDMESNHPPKKTHPYAEQSKCASVSVQTLEKHRKNPIMIIVGTFGWCDARYPFSRILIKIVHEHFEHGTKQKKYTRAFRPIHIFYMPLQNSLNFPSFSIYNFFSLLFLQLTRFSTSNETPTKTTKYNISVWNENE